MPGKTDHEDIDGGYDNKPKRVRETESEQLINDKQAENRDGHRVVPEPLPQQADDQPELDDAVAQKVGRREIARAHREVLRRMEEVIGDEITWVFEQLPRVIRSIIREGTAASQNRRRPP